MYKNLIHPSKNHKNDKNFIKMKNGQSRLSNQDLL